MKKIFSTNNNNTIQLMLWNVLYSLLFMVQYHVVLYIRSKMNVISLSKFTWLFLQVRLVHYSSSFFLLRIKFRKEVQKENVTVSFVPKIRWQMRTFSEMSHCCGCCFVFSNHPTMFFHCFLILILHRKKLRD